VFLLLGRIKAGLTLNLTTLIPGKWNSTRSVLGNGGEIAPIRGILKIEFESDKNGSFIGRLLGYDSDFHVKVTVDRDNPQLFRIEKVTPDGEEHFITEAEMKYSKRNLPHANGKWQNNLENFSLVVLSEWHVDLSIFRKNEAIVDIFRFEKTPIMQMPSIWSVIAPTVIFGLIFIGIRLWDTRRYIVESEKKQASTEESVEKEDEKQKPVEKQKTE
jgi:hypothetical protein